MRTDFHTYCRRTKEHKGFSSVSVDKPINFPVYSHTKFGKEGKRMAKQKNDNLWLWLIFAFIAIVGFFVAIDKIGDFCDAHTLVCQIGAIIIFIAIGIGIGIGLIFLALWIRNKLSGI